MCGIFACAGRSLNSSRIAFEGLRRLEYRGYDSWGVALLSDKKIRIFKEVGKIGTVNLTLPKSKVAIAHTRWATHGKVSKINAHPHFSSDRSFCLVHNGIVENFSEIKFSLQKKGHAFHTQTDTEAIVKLIEENSRGEPDIFSAVNKACLRLKGSNTFLLLTEKGDLVAMRNGPPLVIGVNQTKREFYFSSDCYSFANLTKTFCFVENGQIVKYDQLLHKIAIFHGRSGKTLAVKWKKMNIHLPPATRKHHQQYMIKEIAETPFAIRELLKISKKDYFRVARAVKAARKVYTIGSGTAGVAASQIAYYLRKYANIEAVSLVAADSSEYLTLMNKRDLVICPSQSGETADVVEILEKIREIGVTVVSLVNMPGSLITHLSDFKFLNNSGPEICVMSTKVFTSQISWGYLLAKTVGGKYEAGFKKLSVVEGEIQSYLSDRRNSRNIQQIAALLSSHHDIFLLGKGQNLQIVKEGMIKIIEGSYLHAQAIPAGDLKHFAITLMEKNTPVVMVIANDEEKNTLLNAANEVKARGALVIGIAAFHDDVFDKHIHVPDINETSSIISVIPLQLLAYYLATKLGRDVDRPRNIAKSVTVK